MGINESPKAKSLGTHPYLMAYAHLSHYNRMLLNNVITIKSRRMRPNITAVIKLSHILLVFYVFFLLQGLICVHNRKMSAFDIK